jgi:choline dehydrogenase-like flavoprotein
MKTIRHTEILAAICDTFLPSIQKQGDTDGYWARKGSENGVPTQILFALKRAKREDQQQFEQLLDLLASPMLGLTWFGPLKSFEQLTPLQREKMLKRWARSPISHLRNAFNALRKLCGLIYFGDIPAGTEANPNWKTIGYEPLAKDQRIDNSPLNLLTPGATKSFDCEVLVIGSGAAGSVVAAQLAAQGKDVIILEKGQYFQTHEFHQQEFRSLNQLFEAGGLLTSQDGSITTLAGATLGGGTTINWAACLRTPDYVLDEWAKFGNPHFNDPAYVQGFEAVEKRNHVNTNFEHDAQNLALLRGAQKNNYSVATIPLNLKQPNDLAPETAWKSLGYACYGDRYGIKQGACQTFLQDAVNHQARIITGVEVQRILIQNGAAVGVEANINNTETGLKERITLRASKVVVAAGALHTPVLLLKSGLNHLQIGRNLFLHPVSPTAAFYESDITPWQGPMMSVVVNEFARLDGNYGVRLECPPLHPGLAAFALSWDDGEKFKALMADLKKLAVQIVITRDKYPGRVTVGRLSGQPVIHYKLSLYDRKHLLKGILESAKMQETSGASQIIVPHNNPIHYKPGIDSPHKLAAEIKNRNWRPNDFGLFSAHQMGTCRMGGNKDAPVKPNGESREVRNLFVADGSLFPTASGVNPMLSIQALAYYVAGQISD